MPTKAELEEEINEKLGTDYEWERMKKNDLSDLNSKLDNEEFMKRVVGQYANNKVGAEVEDQIEGWKPGQLVGLIASVSDQESTAADLFL